MSCFSGVNIVEKVSVESVVTDGKCITAVETNRGNIKCSKLINCAGQVSEHNSSWGAVYFDHSNSQPCSVELIGSLIGSLLKSKDNSNLNKNVTPKYASIS